jgi:hypothetical protein
MARVAKGVADVILIAVGRMRVVLHIRTAGILVAEDSKSPRQHHSRSFAQERRE